MLIAAATSPAVELRVLGALVPLYGRDEVRNNAANQPSLLKKISLLTCSPQQPIKFQALQVAAKLCANHVCQDQLVKQGLISNVISFLKTPPPKVTNQVIMSLLDMLLLLVDSPDHFAELKRIGAMFALGTYLTWEDQAIQDNARTLYNLFI